MLYDRPYMRDDNQRERTSVLVWLISAIVAGFVLQIVLGSPWFGGSETLGRDFALTINGVRAGKLWTLVTHSFLHDTHYIFHVIGVILMLYFIGRELLPALGARRFLGLYFGATIVGGLAWTLVHWRLGGMDYGAMAAADAMLIVFACFYPNQQMDFLVFFVLPVTVKPKHLAFAFLGLDLFGLLFYEIPGAALPFDFIMSNSAHLGGMLAGWIYFRFLHEARWNFRSRKAGIALPRWMKRGAKAATPAPGPRVSIGRRDDLRAEVDRILDKINSHGFGALTAAEKRVLDEAKDLLSRR
jgi:membrane associated rhomboid family serine protease